MKKNLLSLMTALFLGNVALSAPSILVAYAFLVANEE